MKLTQFCGIQWFLSSILLFTETSLLHQPSIQKGSRCRFNANTPTNCDALWSNMVCYKLSYTSELDLLTKIERIECINQVNIYSANEIVEKLITNKTHRGDGSVRSRIFYSRWGIEVTNCFESERKSARKIRHTDHRGSLLLSLIDRCLFFITVAYGETRQSNPTITSNGFIIEKVLVDVSYRE